LGIAGLFHDIGMLTLPESVYREPDDMTDDDLELLKTHPEKSYILLKKAGGLNDTVLQAVLQHHERANGTGYPEGLLERQITKNAKLLAIADTYDTLTSDRPYSKSRTPIQAIKMIFSWSGKHFNETLVKFFVSLVGVYPVGTLLKLKSGEIGIVYEITKGNSSKPKILVIFDEQENEVFPFSIDLNEKNIRTGGYVKEIEKTLTPEDITIDIFAVLEKHFIGRN
jgi:HD-GYP domain-containing protein (c-di-GMP phosphodiesterase class II)